MALTYTGQAQTGKRQREAIDDDNGSRLRKSANVGKAADSDDSDDDDLDAREVYTELKEDLPKHPMYDDETIGIAKRCQARVMQVEMILSKSKCATDRVRGFRQKAANIRVVPKPKLVQIAVLGDSGVGKSATSTSIADKPGLAKEGATGRACTNVPTELTSALPGQRVDFGARIQYFCIDSIRDMLQEQVENYIHFNFRMDAQCTEDETVLFRQRSETATSTICAVFCDQPGFESDAAVGEFLNRCQDSPEEAVAHLVEMCRGRLQERTKSVPTDQRSHQETYVANTAMELRDFIDPLMCSKPNGKEPQMWPLVRNATIGVKGSRVLDRATLTDLPGVSDTNQLRVKSATEYLKECDVLWVVAKSDRANTDSSVSALLQKYGERFAGNVAIIVTRSEDYNVEQQVEYLEKQDEYDLREFKKQYAIWEKNYEEAEKLDKRLARLSGSREHKRPSYESRKRIADADAATAKAKWFSILTDFRNDSITKELHKKYDPLMPEGSRLEIFCISNSHYSALKGAPNIPKPHLSAEETGIPRLRHHTLSITAAADLKAFEEYINHKYASTMMGFSLWAHSSRVKSPEELRRIVFRPQQEVKGDVLKYRKRLTQNIQHHITDAFLSRHQAMVTNALNKLKEIERWHWCSVRAFVGNNGNHETKLIPKESWNRDSKVIAIKGVIEPNWNFLMRGQKYEAKALATELKAKIYQMAEELSREPDAHSLPLQRWKDVIDAHVQGIDAACEQYQDEIDRGLLNIKTQAKSDDIDGIFTQAMQPCYDLCKSLSGKDYKKNVLNEFRNFLSRIDATSPFAVMSDWTSNAIEELAGNCGDRLDGRVTNILITIGEDFEAMIDDNEFDAGEEALKQTLREHFADKEDEPKNLKLQAARIVERYASGKVKAERV